MAKRKIDEIPEGEELTGTAPVLTPEEQRDEHDYQIENADREKIDQIILSQDVQKGGKIRIERRGPLDRDYQYVTTIPAEGWDFEASLEWIKKMYGGGDYKCQTFRANGQMYKPFAFSIDHRVKGKLDEDEIKAMAVGSRTNDGLATRLMDIIRSTSGQDSGIKATDLIRVMEAGNSKSEQMTTLLMTMMMKSQETMQNTMAQVMAAVVASRPQQQTSSLDPVIVEILKSKQDRPPMMEVLEIMRAVKDLNREEPEPKEEESMFDKILKAAQLVVPALQGQSALAAGQPPASLPPAQVPPPPQPLPNRGLIAALPPAMQLGIGQLIRAAERNSDPTLYADLIIDQLEEPRHLLVLKTILTDPAWKAKLFGDESRVAHIAPWLDALRQQLLAYEPDGAVNPNDPGAGPGIPSPTNGVSAGQPPDSGVPGDGQG